MSAATVELAPWEARQREEARLFNPAFLATLLAAAAADHERVSSRGLPWPLAFLVAPLVLYEDTRQELPANTNSRLVNWISSQPILRSHLALRARALGPYVRESARFGMREGALTFSGAKLHSPLDAGALRSATSGEASECVTRAAFLGRWFSSVVDIASIYALFGIAP